MKKNRSQRTNNKTPALDAFIKLVRASESVSRRIHRHLADAGLSVSQFGVLEALYHVGPLSQMEIAGKILKSTGNITMVIDNLEKRGLVKRERSAEDRRLYAVQLTATGRKLIEDTFPRHAEQITQEMNVLTRAEQEELSRLCKKVGLQREQ